MCGCLRATARKPAASRVAPVPSTRLRVCISFHRARVFKSRMEAAGAHLAVGWRSMETVSFDPLISHSPVSLPTSSQRIFLCALPSSLLVFSSSLSSPPPFPPLPSLCVSPPHPSEVSVFKAPPPLRSLPRCSPSHSSRLLPCSPKCGFLYFSYGTCRSPLYFCCGIHFVQGRLSPWFMSHERSGTPPSHSA